MIDENIAWTDHIKYLTNKIGSILGIICCKRHLLPLHYCIEIYANTTRSNLNSLIKKCNSMLRVLQNKPRRTSLYELYSKFNTLPVNLLFKLFALKLLHRCLYNKRAVPKVISSLFTQVLRSIVTIHGPVITLFSRQVSIIVQFLSMVHLCETNYLTRFNLVFLSIRLLDVVKITY